MAIRHKYIGTTEYNGVSEYEDLEGNRYFRFSRGKQKANRNNISKSITSKPYETARECAIDLDKYLISIGKEPINILKKK